MSTPPPPPASPYVTSPQPLNPADERLWSTLIHVGSIFFGFLSPLIGYLVLKDRGPFIRAHAATSLNFQLTILIASIVGVLTAVLVVGIFILIAVGIVAIVMPIIAAVRANQGQWFTYPLSIPFVH